MAESDHFSLRVPRSYLQTVVTNVSLPTIAGFAGLVDSVGLGSFISVLLASVVGSAHCVGMCGGFVAFCNGCSSGQVASRWSMAAYHLGRLIAYCTVGAVAGALGFGIQELSVQTGLPRDAGALVVGAMLVLWGGYAVFGGALEIPARLPSRDGVHAIGKKPPERLLTKLLRAAALWPAWLRNGALGLATILLPCGWLYAFALIAAQTGSAVEGATVLFAFWSGTLPLLVLFGYAVKHLSSSMRRLLPRAGGAFLVLAGFLSLFAHLQSTPEHCAHSAADMSAPGDLTSVK